MNFVNCLFLFIGAAYVGYVSAVAAPNLASCMSFAIHGFAGVAASADRTLVYGDVGGDNAITGFAVPGTLGDANRLAVGFNYAFHSLDSASNSCSGDKTSAYNFAKGSTCGHSLVDSNAGLVNCTTATTWRITTAGNCSTTAIPVPSSDLSGLTLYPGVYCTAAGFFRLTAGHLTLDGQGSYDSVFIFQAASDIITSVNTEIILSNGAQAKNVFWQAGSAVVLGDDSMFAGNIYAFSSVNIGHGTRLIGRAFASTESVTLAGSDKIALPELTAEGGSNKTGIYVGSASGSFSYPITPLIVALMFVVVLF